MDRWYGQGVVREGLSSLTPKLRVKVECNTRAPSCELQVFQNQITEPEVHCSMTEPAVQVLEPKEG